MKEKQVDVRDCSLFVLKWFYDHFNFNSIDITELKLNAKYTENGISIPDFETLAKNYNFAIEVFNCDFASLLQLDTETFPIAALIKKDTNTHMVVIKKITDNKIKLYDPIFGNQSYNYNDFKMNFYGLVINFKKIEESLHISKDFKQNSWFKMDKFSSFYLLALLCEILILFSLPYFNKIILEKIIPNKLNVQLLYLGIVFIFVVLLNFALKNLSQKILQKILARRRESITLNFIKNLKFINYKVIDKLSVLEAKNRIVVFDSIIQFSISFLPEVISSFLTLFLALVLLWNINLYLMIIIVIYSILTLIISFITKNIYDKEIPKLMQENLLADNAFNNYYNHIKNIPNYYLEERLFNTLSASYQNMNLKLLTFKEKTISLNSFLATLDVLAPLCILILGSYQIWNNKLSTVNLIFFLTGASLFTRPIKNILPIVSLYSEFKKAFSLLKVFKFEEEDIEQSKSLESKITTIKLSSVSYSYTESKLNKALNIQSCLINKKYHLVGPNGSGKSTLCAILNGAKQADDGEILINDQKINPFFDASYKEKVIYIGKDNDLNLSVLDYLCISNLEQFYELINHLQLNKCLQHLNINLTRNISLNNLSSGQKQFIALLSLFLLPYDLVLLDEAFENLDFETFEILKAKLKSELDSSIVLEISHNKRYLYPESEDLDVQKISA
ncbi:Mbov_0121 family peptidase domain-containing ABC transporter [Mycoplasma sp. Sp33II]|uniref:Mbov_0121 family peptidase domain-containing ABC transporter n=1 Tax=unclassified Mycoplasma TaxID=2683645 RepID=UPI003AAF1C6D